MSDRTLPEVRWSADQMVEVWVKEAGSEPSNLCDWAMARALLDARAAREKLAITMRVAFGGTDVAAVTRCIDGWMNAIAIAEAERDEALRRVAAMQPVVEAAARAKWLVEETRADRPAVVFVMVGKDGFQEFHTALLAYRAATDAEADAGRRNAG